MFMQCLTNQPLSAVFLLQVPYLRDLSPLIIYTIYSACLPIFPNVSFYPSMLTLTSSFINPIFVPIILFLHITAFFCSSRCSHQHSHTPSHLSVSQTFPVNSSTFSFYLSSSYVVTSLISIQYLLLLRHDHPLLLLLYQARWHSHLT